jgi:hypothetical protein
MSSASSDWYVAAAGESPSGPFTEARILEACRSGSLAPTMLCWRNGMAQWLPLAQAEPFASSLRGASAVPPPVPRTALPLPPAVTAAATGDYGPDLRPTSGAATGLAIAAIVFAVPALLVSIIPLLGVFAIYPAAFALLLSLTAIGVAVANKSQVGGLPTAALAMSLVPLVIAGYWIVSVRKAANELAEFAEKVRAPAAVATDTGAARREWQRWQTDTGNPRAIPTAPAAEPPSIFDAAGVPVNRPPAGKSAGTEPARPASATTPQYGAPPLENGVVVGDQLSVAVVGVTRGTELRISGVDEYAEFTLAFRRLGTRSFPRSFYLVAEDDRGNSYDTNFYLGHEGPGGVRGSPHDVESLPLGFTWTGKVRIEMPRKAPIAGVVLKNDGHTDPLPMSDFKTPSVEPNVSAGLRVQPGRRFRLDKNLEATIGELTVVATAKVGTSMFRKTVKGPGLSLAISVANEDYTPHGAGYFFVYVQTGDGHVRPYAMPSCDDPVPGKQTETMAFVMRDDFLEEHGGPTPSDVVAVLLYYRAGFGSGGDDMFCGFVPIPDDVRRGLVAEGARQPASQVAPQGAASALSTAGLPAVSAPSGTAFFGTGPSGAGPTGTGTRATGVWRSGQGADLRISDDGTSLRIDLDDPSSGGVKEFRGALAWQADEKMFAGTIAATFSGKDWTTKRSLKTTAVLDKDGSLRLQFGDWPEFTMDGKVVRVNQATVIYKR